MSAFTESTPIARKDYRCDECLGCIPKGRRYFRQTGIDGSEFINFKAHKTCAEIAFVINYGFCGEWSNMHEATRIDIIEAYLEVRSKREHNKNKEDYGLVLS